MAINLRTLLNVADGIAGMFTPRGGSSARIMRDKLRDYVHLLDFIPADEHSAIFDGSSNYDCLPAMVAAISAATFNPEQYTSGQAAIRVGPGSFYFSGAIELKRTVTIDGDGCGMAGGKATILRFPADSHGIIVHRFDTIGNGVQAPATTGADGSILRGLYILGGHSDVSQRAGAGHGVWMRARARIENCVIDGFAENGCNIVAGVSVEGAGRGNANCWRIDTVRITNCGGHGHYVNGGDANAGTAIGLDCVSNGKSGIFDSSFLGNTYTGCHVAFCGLNGQVAHEGNRYYCANDTGGGETTPGTDPAVWALVGPGEAQWTYPAWTSGQEYYMGNGYRTDNPNARNTFFGCYTEGGQPPSLLVAPTVVVGGILYSGGGATDSRSTALFIGGTTSGGELSPVWINPRVLEGNPYSLGLRTGGDVAIQLAAEGDGVNGLGLMQFDGENWVTRHRRLTARTPVRYTTDLNTLAAGRTAPIDGGNVLFAQGAWIGRSTTTVRHVTADTAAPTAGEWARGDYCRNSAPAVSQPKGWICTVSGTPGTWVSEGNL